MSGRTTSEIEDDLRYTGNSLDREAADRLAELDAENEKHKADARLWEAAADDWEVEAVDRGGLLAKIDAALPPCPTCAPWPEGLDLDEMTDTIRSGHPCPENGGNCDGKVTIERLVNLHNAVFDEEFDEDTTDSRRCAFLYLRSVR